MKRQRVYQIAGDATLLGGLLAADTVVARMASAVFRNLWHRSGSASYRTGLVASAVAILASAVSYLYVTVRGLFAGT